MWFFTFSGVQFAFPPHLTPEEASRSLISYSKDVLVSFQTRDSRKRNGRNLRKANKDGDDNGIYGGASFTSDDVRGYAGQISVNDSLCFGLLNE